MTQPTANDQLAHQFCRQSSTTPPKTAARDQLHLASTRSSTENLQSPLSRVTCILTRRVSVLQEDEIHDERDSHDDENNANKEDDLSNGLGNSLSNGLGNNLSEPEPTTQSEIAAMREMMEEQRENQLHTVDRDEFKYRQLH